MRALVAPASAAPSVPSEQNPRGHSAHHARQLLTLNQPRPVHVVTDLRGTPTTIHLSNRARRVEHIRESWRIDDEWWRTPISRQYVRVVLDTGRLVTLYLDLEEQRWYLQDA